MRFPSGLPATPSLLNPPAIPTGPASWRPSSGKVRFLLSGAECYSPANTAFFYVRLSSQMLPMWSDKLNNFYVVLIQLQGQFQMMCQWYILVECTALTMCPGGVVEAYPPSDSVTCLTVDLLLEPGGEVTMLSCGDQLHGSCHLETVGSTVPQTSVNPETLRSICMRVGQACLQRLIVGYVSVDLATFVDHNTMEQKVRHAGLEKLWDHDNYGQSCWNKWCQSFLFHQTRERDQF